MNDTLNRLNKISRYAGLAVKALMVFLIAVIALVLILMIVTALDPEMVLDNVDEFTKSGQVLSMCAIIIVAVAFGLIALYYADRLFTNVYKNGTPFMDDNVKCLERLAILLLVGTVILPIISAAGIYFLEAQSDLLFQFNPAMLFMALLFYFLSLIFKYGVALQKDSDETL
ncbi:MAG: DUF2975 domain-containing protein [Methanomassiliicoccaceae archaeon]|nr:DUF2975 domain-containing protein [Methanomassiliicoccaceae archaeon]